MIAEQLKYENAETIRRWQQGQEDRDQRVRFRQSLNGLLGDANGLVTRLANVRPHNLSPIRDDLLSWTREVYTAMTLPPACCGQVILRGVPLRDPEVTPANPGRMADLFWKANSREEIDKDVAVADPEQERHRLLTIVITISDRLSALEARLPFP